MTANEKLDLLLKEVGVIKGDVQVVKQDVHQTHKEVGELKNNYQMLKTDVQGLKNDVQELKGDVQGLKGDMVEVKGRLRSLETTLENVTNRNIAIIAEGHLDLMRKLNEALDLTTETEMYRIRFNVLDDDVRLLKEAVF